MSGQSPLSADRILVLEGVHNFRDFGGYRLASGGIVRRRYLWRSGQHHGATDADLDRVAALDLAAVFDLRSSRERGSHPCRRPPAFGATIHLSQDPGRQAAPHIAAAQGTRERTPEGTRAGLIRNYAKMPFRPELQDMTSRMIAIAAGGKGPLLVNCMAGKDRTGIAVALLQLATGVHRDDVLEDYLLTNTAGDPEARIAAGAETIRTVTGDVDEASLRVLMGVEAEYLETALAAIAAEYGTIDQYLKVSLDVDASKRARLAEALTEH